jgi:hypothetical protein
MEHHLHAKSQTSGTVRDIAVALLVAVTLHQLLTTYFL